VNELVQNHTFREGGGLLFGLGVGYFLGCLHSLVTVMRRPEGVAYLRAVRRSRYAAKYVMKRGPQ